MDGTKLKDRVQELEAERRLTVSSVIREEANRLSRITDNTESLP